MIVVNRLQPPSKLRKLRFSFTDSAGVSRVTGDVFATADDLGATEVEAINRFEARLKRAESARAIQMAGAGVDPMASEAKYNSRAEILTALLQHYIASPISPELANASLLFQSIDPDEVKSIGLFTDSEIASISAAAGVVGALSLYAGALR